MARIRRAHGVKGEVLVEVLTDIPDRLTAESSLWLESDRGIVPVRVLSSRPHAHGLLLGLDALGDRDEAEEARGAYLTVAREEVPAAPEGSYYHFQLVGCRCHDRAAGPLGEVTAVGENGGGLMLEVTGGERKLLIPFVRSFLERVDVEAGRIDLRLPEGLIETCASTSSPSSPSSSSRS